MIFVQFVRAMWQIIANKRVITVNTLVRRFIMPRRGENIYKRKDGR